MVVIEIQFYKQLYFKRLKLRQVFTLSYLHQKHFYNGILRITFVICILQIAKLLKMNLQSES
jgi:hypothetical protein